ncbi:hypothetical protein KKF91_04025 [Myxococcota bacterium]|nr:hypothetical protein [Myxococcota bacterium]MBU1429712.1 hypothetical protein [Myxococcota bacterium]MBU1899800.1 hypothetical protein [Myxococcota bacterium]
MLSRARGKKSLCLFILCVGCLAPEGGGALRVLGSAPGEGEALAADAPARVYFDGHLDPTLSAWDAVTLKSGDLSLSVTARYDPIDDALLIWRPQGWRPGLGYTITLNAARIISWDGRPLEADFTLNLRATPAAAAPPPAGPSHAQVIEARCGCHALDVAPRLTVEALAHQPSLSMPGLELIAPGRPQRSALLLRTLPGWSPRGPMPPAAPLSEAEARALSDWIEALALDGAL